MAWMMAAGAMRHMVSLHTAFKLNIADSTVTFRKFKVVLFFRPLLSSEGVGPTRAGWGSESLKGRKNDENSVVGWVRRGVTGVHERDHWSRSDVRWDRMGGAE